MISLIAANWKMNKSLKEGVEFMNELNNKMNEIKDKIKDKEILICPPFTLLQELKKIKHDSIKLGAQNCYSEESGAFTGEVSAVMLKDFCEYVILGHSERRSHFKETNQMINKKIKIVVKNNLKPILCVGETANERKKNKAKDVIQTQLKTCLKNITENEIKKTTIAYEPIWAIGTGKTATPQEAQEIHDFIRKELRDMYSEGTAMNIRIIYGGSINPENIKELMQQRDINGGLVGGAGLDVKSFVEIIKNI